MPTVLGEDAGVLVAAVKRVELALVVLTGNSEQVVGEIEAGLAAGEQKVAVELGDGIYVDLVVMKFTADFDGVASDNFGKIIEHLKCIVGLFEFVGVGAGGEVIENQILHALVLRSQRHDGGDPG